jgi:hypothetical protein
VKTLAAGVAVGRWRWRAAPQTPTARSSSTRPRRPKPCPQSNTHVEHPLAPPTLSGNLLTVDLALQNPTIVTRRIMDLTLQKFIADRVFASAGGVTGGAVIYTQATLNDLYLDRDVAHVQPGGDFPIVAARGPRPSSHRSRSGAVSSSSPTRRRTATTSRSSTTR